MSGKAEYRVLDDKIYIDPELSPEANLAAAIIRRAIMDAKRFVVGLDDDFNKPYHNRWEVVNFFESRWCDQLLSLTDITGHDIRIAIGL